MKTIIILIIFCLPMTLWPNINFIHFDKIPSSKKYSHDIDFLLKNENYFKLWYLKWPFKVKKDKLVKKLQQCYTDFSKETKKNTELYLLLGDICHYLYNLDKMDYHELVLKYYKAAIKSAPKDYRGYWFLATHYSLSAAPHYGMKYFIAASKLLPENPPYIFWDEYALTAYGAIMPSHALYAMHKVRQLIHRPGEFEKKYGKILKKLFIKLDLDSTYSKEDTWRFDIKSEEENLVTVLSRPIGLKFTINGDWELQNMGFNRFITI